MIPFELCQQLFPKQFVKQLDLDVWNHWPAWFSWMGG